MDDITLLQECVVKVEEIKEELNDSFENGERDMLGKNSDKVNAPVAVLLQPKVEMVEEAEEQVKFECSTIDLPVSEQNDSDEEELKPLAAVYIKTEVETDEGTKKEEHLANYPLRGCEDWDEKKPLPGSFLLRLKKEEAAEPEEEGDAGSNKRSEQTAFEEMKDAAEDACGSNRAESRSEEHETSEPENKDLPSHTNRQPLADVRCSETIPKTKTLKEHEQEHRSEPQLLTCDTCQRQFSDRRGLLCHTRAHLHKGDKKTNFPCETCGKEFKHRGKLNVHLRIHTGEKSCICDYCGKGFTQEYNMNKHRRKHTGEQPYSCSICSKRFSEKRSLVAHTRRHLNIKPYECKECGKTFVESCNYTQHLRVHTGEKPHKCSVCSKTFIFRGDLNCHMRVHTGERPYKCKFCEATFSRSSNRLRHEETHSGRKAIQCTECDKSLLSKEKFKLHMRSHTEGKH